MICIKCRKGEFKMIEYIKLIRGKSAGIYQCQDCGYKELIK